VRRRRDRGQAPRGNVPGVAAADGTGRDAGRTPEAPLRCRGPDAAQPVLASAAQPASAASQVAGHAQAPVRPTIPLLGPTQSHRNDRLPG